MKRLFFCAILFSLSSQAKLVWPAREMPREIASQKDPFEAVDHFTLDNGLEVYLAPSADAIHTSVRVEVEVGWEAEDKSNFGVAHLLEHVLFRDKQLADEMSYLQLIKEAGGETNGQTEGRSTSYYGTIPHAKGTWMFEQFTKMLLNPSLSAENVSKEKTTVELERGRPNPFVEALGFDIRDIYNRYARAQTFWESEFNVSFEPKFTLAEEQLSTRRLTVDQVRQLYEDYYVPSNIKIFVTGKFKESEIKKALEPWTHLEKREGKKLGARPDADPRKKPFIYSTITMDTPYLYIGTKLWDVSLADYYILDAYIEYVAHRLMKEVRNKKGQTYSARSTTYTFKDYGYTYLNFETTKENFRENFKLARDYIANEARTGGLTEDQMYAAISLFLNKYNQVGRDADDMMLFSRMVRSSIVDYGSFESPHRVFAHMTLERFNEVLKKNYAPERKYQYLYRPPLFFHYDLYLFRLFMAVVSLAIIRQFLLRKFNHDKIRWVRKVRYPPLFLVEISTVVLSLAFYGYFYYFAQKLFLRSTFIQSHVILSQYFFDCFMIFSFFMCFQFFAAFVPRKLMVVGDDLFIKSISYFSRKISLKDIESVETVSAMSFPFPLSSWLVAVGPTRFFFVNPMFWQKGLLIHLKNGKAYFFSISNAADAKKELRRLMPNPPDDGDAKFPLAS